MSAENTEGQLTPQERFEAVFSQSAEIIGGGYDRFRHIIAINRVRSTISELGLSHTPGILERYGGLVSLAMCQADLANDTTGAQRFKSIAEYIAEQANRVRRQKYEYGPTIQGFCMN